MYVHEMLKAHICFLTIDRGFFQAVMFLPCNAVCTFVHTVWLIIAPYYMTEPLP